MLQRLYTTQLINFVQQNTDTLPKDFVDCASESTNSLIRDNTKGPPLLGKTTATGAKGCCKKG